MEELKINHRLIMTPGPAMVDPRVLQAMSNQILGQFDPDFTQIMNENMEMIRQSFNTINRWSFPIDGTSRAGDEAVISSIVRPGDSVLIPVFGRFGDLFVELARRAGGEVHTLNTDWGSVFDQDVIIEEINRLKPKVVAIVHGETSTGRLQPLDRIGAAVHEYGGFLVVDAVASYLGTSLEVDKWQLDAVIGGAQKCLSIPSGITPITFNDRFAAEINQRKQVEQGIRTTTDPTRANFISSNYLDLTQLQDYWSPRRLNHHTEATVADYALHEGLYLALKEGLLKRIARHLLVHRALNAGLKAMGLEIYHEGENEMPMVTCVMIPSGLNDIDFRNQLLTTFQVEISGSFGSLTGKIWRIGTMGYTAQPGFVMNFIALFGAALLQSGVKVDLKAGLDAAQLIFTQK
ncbi:pyridoxal-phosphate-dependent aminotransferase family protein [Liquorilactobacillus satsumensis]|uniref:pyridoxal-phosphate-dependent aminotransferase family protein n=1 Tax=Liquorilactobacillus satsumensis TaxID=259059 RepID=UPI0039ECD107